jgi:membrane protease YdiL (CAAX protease family)
MTGEPEGANIERMSIAAAPAPDAPSVSADAPGAAPTTLYFAIALTLCTVALLPACLATFGVLSGRPEEYMAGAPLAAFSPTIAAVISSWREGGWARVRQLFRGFRAWRVSPLWYVVALALPTVVFTVGRAVYALGPGTDGGAWFYPPDRPEHFGSLLVIPIAEEIGWRGYALPRLIARHGALAATGIMGVFWTLWHIPMFFAVGSTPYEVLVCMAFIFVGNPVCTWIYRRGGGSLLIAILFHAGVALDGMIHALPGNITPMYIAIAAYIVFSLALLTLDRRAFQGRTPEAPGTRPALA